MFDKYMSLIKRGKMRGRKGAVEMEALAWWIIAIVILVIVLAAYFILSGKGMGMLDYIKNLFRFGK